MSCVACRVSHSGVICCVSPVICQLSLTPIATATDPPPANSPIMHSRLFCKDPKNHRIFDNAKNPQNGKNTKMSRGIPILAIRSSTRSLPSTGKQVFRNGTTSVHCCYAHTFDKVGIIFNFIQIFNI